LSGKTVETSTEIRGRVINRKNNREI